MDSVHTASRAQPGAAPGSTGRDPKRLVAFAIVILAAAWLISFVVSNSQKVKVSFVFGDVSLSLIWVMILCAVLGAVLVLATQQLSRRRR